MFIIILCISLVAVLYLNYESKIFLGDSATYSLGFLISYLIITTAKDTGYVSLSADKIFILMMLPGLELISILYANKLNVSIKSDKEVIDLFCSDVIYKTLIKYIKKQLKNTSPTTSTKRRSRRTISSPSSSQSSTVRGFSRKLKKKLSLSL